MSSIIVLLTLRTCASGAAENSRLIKHHMLSHLPPFSAKCLELVPALGNINNRCVSFEWTIILNLIKTNINSK